jgi:hypothetical protein
MKRAFLFFTILLLAFTSQAFPCFNPTDLFATEVVLNKPGAGFDLTLIESAKNVFFDDGAFVYRSHFDQRVAVILSVVDEADILKGLSVRVQIPTKFVLVDGVEDLAEAVDIDREKFDFKTAMRTELDWLNVNKIITGITREDIGEISDISEAGLAGWNSRIVYENEKWLPYNETDKPLLFRDVDCGGFSLGKLPSNEETIILADPSSVSSRDKLATSWGKIRADL